MLQQKQTNLRNYARLLLKIFLISTIIISFTINGCNKKQEEEDKMEVVRYGRFVVKIRETGNLEPLVSVAVRSNVEGEIERILIEEGDFVQKGQEDDDPQAQLQDCYIQLQAEVHHADLRI